MLAYEIRLARLAAVPADPIAAVDEEEIPATHEEMERFFGHLSELMDDIDFHKGRAPEMVSHRLRRLFLRARPDPREIRILRGLFSDAQRLARIARSR